MHAPSVDIAHWKRLKLMTDNTRSRASIKARARRDDDDDEDVATVKPSKQVAENKKKKPNKTLERVKDDEEDEDDDEEELPSEEEEEEVQAPSKKKSAVAAAAVKKKKKKPTIKGGSSGAARDDVDREHPGSEDDEAGAGAGAGAGSGAGASQDKRVCQTCNKRLVGKNRITMLFREDSKTPQTVVHETHHWACVRRLPRNADVTRLVGILRVGKTEDLPLWDELSAKQQGSAKANKTRLVNEANGKGRRQWLSGMGGSALYG